VKQVSCCHGMPTVYVLQPRVAFTYNGGSPIIIALDLIGCDTNAPTLPSLGALLWRGLLWACQLDHVDVTVNAGW
jgi:hypothetical protein